MTVYSANIRISNEDLVRSKLLIKGWKETYVKGEKKRPLRRKADTACH